MDKLTMSNVGKVRVGKRIGFSLCAAPLHTEGIEKFPDSRNLSTNF